MDFYKISTSNSKKGVIEVYPDFIVGRIHDLMIRGKTFYAIWDEEKGLWSTDEYDVARIVDETLYSYKNELENKVSTNVKVKSLTNFSNGSWDTFKRYLNKAPDNYHQLDTKITFSNTEVSKNDYISKRLDYPLEKGKCPSYEKLMSTLYSPDERRKLEWAIGAIISGDARKIQKFIVLYGDAGAGKSTVLNIIQKLFKGYYTTFDAKELTNANSSFATDAFSMDPLVAIQHDGDLSNIKDNSVLNSIVSHEEIIVNEKFKARYSTRANCFLFMATNKPVKITDGKSGLIRRLIDVKPSGNKLPTTEYNDLYSKIDFELGAIAYHCLEVYNNMGKNYYSTYKPIEMMYKTDPFFNFVEDSYFIFKDQNSTSLKQAYSMYKDYCNDTGSDYKLQQYKFREELKNYFHNFYDEIRLDDGTHVRSYYEGFLISKFKNVVDTEKDKIVGWLKFNTDISLFDNEMKNMPAQLANESGIPSKRWNNVTTKLHDISTKELHFVKVPENHIVIDFDIKDENGNKSYEKNLEAANKWPKTYAELSKSEAGIHLHYIYTGDATKIKNVYDKDIEIKVYTGNASLRRKLTKCNDIPVAVINSGLPLKEVKGDKMVNFESIKQEKGLRTLIAKNLKKEIHPGTKPSIDFIFKILEDAYNNGVNYDVTDMRPAVLAFAANSSNQSYYCINLVNKMKFKSEDISKPVISDKKELIFYDVEVFPNLFLVNWKKKGDANIVRMINPTPQQIETLLNYNLVGFNCRRYDNHIMYARFRGYTNEELYRLSQRIINTDKSDDNKNCFFGEAWNLSYTDIYDYSSKKQSLKKWEIELGIHHQELGLPWDQPVPEELWPKVSEYCDNDVIATEAVWDATTADFLAREILVAICLASGVDACVNDTTNSLTTKIIFGKEKHPDLVYTDLATGKQSDPEYQRNDILGAFPGYEYVDRKNMYMGEDVGYGGYVYAEPGIYHNVALIDVASMHPHSILAMNCFGEYTERFNDIVTARILIKHHEYDKAKELLNGALAPYLGDEKQADALSKALKIPINSVYGLTSAKFENPFKDRRNVNNIVALRGALFMVGLKHEVQNRGFTVVHIKTDSIKIADATPDIIKFCMDYATSYGYSFEHEATYEKICLVNNAVYIAKYSNDESVNGKHCGEWTATGTEFQVPYIFKTLFSHEDLEFSDLCESKSVKSALYLDFNENLPNVELLENIQSLRESEASNITKKNKELLEEYGYLSDEELNKEISKGHNYHFVGKVGLFCPVKDGTGGGLLVREGTDSKGNNKYYSATGAKGYRWKEAEVVRSLGEEDTIDISYYEELANDAIASINEFGNYEEFVK